LKSEEKKRSKEVVDSQPPPSAEPAQVDATAIETAAPAETPVAEAGNGAEQFVLDNATIDPPAVDEIVDSVEQVSAVRIRIAVPVHPLIQESQDQALDTNDEAEGSTAPVAVSPEEALIPQEDVTADIEIDAEQGAEDVNEEDAIKADNGEQDMDTSAQPEAGQDGQQQHGMQNMMAFNPMMQMPGFGGFNPMMGEFTSTPSSSAFINTSHRHAWNGYEPDEHALQRLWWYGHEQHEWHEHGHELWRRIQWLEWSRNGRWQFWRSWRWLLSPRWI